MNIRNISLIIFGTLSLTSSAIHTKVITISSVDEYKRHYNSDKPMVTMYSATWCGPCKAMKPLFHGAAATVSDITFALVDTTTKGLSEITKGIRSLPTVIFSHKGKQVKTEVGSRTRPQFDRHINEFRAQIAPKIPTKPNPQIGQAKKRTISTPKPRPRRTQKA